MKKRFKTVFGRFLTSFILGIGPSLFESMMFMLCVCVTQTFYVFGTFGSGVVFLVGGSGSLMGNITLFLSPLPS